ncbi:phosphoribosylamine--glycine ligase [Luteibaculum oceani]|uniref:Phosphoribosylamine--glycine ligase n=1 Tax=Luteibaculum oceani TaxID=1294296 RepID=A0A5C6VKJ7_9FLAO|nr:phosphoribosylamine--glycine ligase [Luteibaculum oceani]TXC85194.1 phosphoribosylamine--glycine ligase [Luteibaculum oceani]
MNVLVLGSGGREHTIAHKIAQSSLLDQLYVAPGNAGTAQIATNLNIKETDFQAVKKAVLDHNISLVVVGPEAPLVAGISDFFAADKDLSHVNILGPKKAGAILEGSKDFSKAFMKRHNIPTAAYQTFGESELLAAYKFLDQLKAPYVLKADGLAAGKGVLILDSKEEAKAALKEMLEDKKFGEASAKVVIEEFLSGIELSVFVLTDGKNYRILPEAKDYKRIGEGDTGLNTGGMGAVSPVKFADRVFMEKVENNIVIPTIKGLQKEDIEYCGFIFIGLMNVNGDPYVIEYNCRMGDPETEVVIPRIQSDLLVMFDSVFDGTLSEADLAVDPRTATTVIAVSGGYPEAYEKGKKIVGLEEASNKDKSEELLVFHAGTKLDGEDVLTNGGRVLAFTSLGADMEKALQGSYKALNKVCFDGIYYRKDIGQDLI